MNLFNPPLSSIAQTIAAGAAGKILQVRSTADLPRKCVALPDSEDVALLLPGLRDCCVHFFSRVDPHVENLALLHPAPAGARVARDTTAMSDAEYTSVREVRRFGAEVSKAINEGWLPGHNVCSSVALLSQNASHVDLQTTPLELAKDRNKHGFCLWICGGVDESIKAVRTQIRRAVKLIKVPRCWWSDESHR